MGIKGCIPELELQLCELLARDAFDAVDTIMQRNMFVAILRIEHSNMQCSCLDTASRLNLQRQGECLIATLDLCAVASIFKYDRQMASPRRQKQSKLSSQLTCQAIDDYEGDRKAVLPTMPLRQFVDSLSRIQVNGVPTANQLSHKDRGGFHSREAIAISCGTCRRKSWRSRSLESLGSGQFKHT